MIDLDACFRGEHVVSQAEFAALNPTAKGYLTYMLGARPDQPHVTDDYQPPEAERGAFDHGQHLAVIEAQDNP